MECFSVLRYKEKPNKVTMKSKTKRSRIFGGNRRHFKMEGWTDTKTRTRMFTAAFFINAPN
jgi:hypothetical protein